MKWVNNVVTLNMKWVDKIVILNMDWHSNAIISNMGWFDYVCTINSKKNVVYALAIHVYIY